MGMRGGGGKGAQVDLQTMREYQLAQRFTRHTGSIILRITLYILDIASARLSTQGAVVRL